MCAPLNGTSYRSTTGTEFDIICGIGYGGNDIGLRFALDLLSCIEICSQWNINNSVQCEGVAWNFGNFGPGGEVDGSQCWLKWTMAQYGYEATVDTGRLQTAYIVTIDYLVGC